MITLDDDADDAILIPNPRHPPKNNSKRKQMEFPERLPRAYKSFPGKGLFFLAYSFFQYSPSFAASLLVVGIHFPVEL